MLKTNAQIKDIKAVHGFPEVHLKQQSCFFISVIWNASCQKSLYFILYKQQAASQL